MNTGDRNNYKVEHPEVGRGGYAIVYRATHKATGAVVAFKRTIEDDEESLGRLRREIQEQGRLDHPHIMPILDQCEHGHWFTMPLAEGDLEKLRPRLTEDDLLTALDQVAEGLAAAHDRGLLHRDVTPRTILALADDELGRTWVLGDWGLVRRPRGKTTVHRTQAKHPFGTDGFAAPEMYDDAHAATSASDVYSLGRVAAWAVTGQWPKPNVPLEPEGRWRNLVRRTTQMDPARRVQTMAEFRELLDEIREQRQEHGGPLVPS